MFVFQYNENKVISSVYLLLGRRRELDQHLRDGDMGPVEQHQQRLHAPHRRDHRDQEQAAAAFAQGI